MPLLVSLSAYQTWQRCETQYYYRYVRKLRPILPEIAPERGIMLHGYLEAYYRSLREGLDRDKAHERGQYAIMEYTDKLKVAAATAFYGGNEELAQEYQSLLGRVVDIAERYFNVRGKTDADQFEILAVEETIDLALAGGITSRSVIDLVARERDRGLVWLWEHKSVKAVPDSKLRIRDLQTLLYATVFERTRGIHIDGIMWNYLRTKDPDVPHQNKSKGKAERARFSVAQSVDTTRDIWERTLRSVGEDPDDPYYATIAKRLEHADTTIWFPRYEHVIVADPGLLLNDYAIEATRIRYARWAWEQGVATPVRSIRRDCDFCPFYRVCEAVITGGDEEDAIRMKFTVSTRESASEEEPTA